MPILAALAPFIKPVLGAVAGGFVNSYFEKKSQRDKYGFLESKGLTPQEIAGSSGSSASSSGVGNVLGNQQAELTRIREQQAYDEKQRNLDRAVAVRSQDMNLASAEASAAPMHGRNAIDRNRLDLIDVPQASQDLITSSPEFRLRQLQMQMGPDNVYAEGLLKRYGLSLNDDSIAKASPETWNAFVRDFQSYRSQVATEAAGAATALGSGAGGLSAGLEKGASVLGGFNPLRPENWPQQPPVLGGPSLRY